MHESPDDVVELQRLLDDSFASAGAHLRSIWSEEHRLAAEELSSALPGVQELILATVTPRGEPRVAPVDGLFYRGRFWFGSAESSGRFRNIRENAAVSGAVVRGQTFAVIVHGHAVECDPRGPEAEGFGDYARAVYTGFDWDAEFPDAPYARIHATRLFAYHRRAG